MGEPLIDASGIFHFCRPTLNVHSFYSYLLLRPPPADPTQSFQNSDEMLRIKYLIPGLTADHPVADR